MPVFNRILLISAVGKPAVFILSQEIDYNRTTVQRRTDHKNNTKSNSAETHFKKHRKVGKNNEVYEQPLWPVKNFWPRKVQDAAELTVFR